MNSFRMLFLLTGLLLSFGSVAQVRSLNGKVTDKSGMPLIGATIIAEETRESGLIGTTADIEGHFRLDLPDGVHLIRVSFTGYKTQSLDTRGMDFVEVVMESSVDLLQEVVVTALGIKREEKALGYSVRSVGEEEIRNMSSVNPLGALAGLSSGLQVSASGGGAGGSTKVLIRGASSLTGSNDPLYVVDGVPMNNAGGVSGSQFGGFDYGNAANNINLSDIESISILKGGAASALYGARGQNGVIMITTRSGSRREGIGIGYQTSFSFEQALIVPDFQNLYSQGSSRQFERLGVKSWGALMHGQQVSNFLNQPQILLPSTEHPYDFFRTATNYDQTLSLDKRGETNAVFFSASWNQNKGILPGNQLDRKSFNLRYESQMARFLSFDARANFVQQQADNRPNLAGSPDNPVYLFASMPRSVRLEHLERFQTTDGYPVVWNSLYKENPDGTIAWDLERPAFASSPLLQNPFWATNLNTNADKRDRLIGFAELRLDLRELFDLKVDLDLKMRAGMDTYTDERKRITAHNTYYKSEGRATGSFSHSQFLERNYDMLLSFGHGWGDISLLASVGGNIMHRRIRSLNTSSESGLINLVGPYVIQNFLNPLAAQGIANQEIQSLYAMLSADYRRMIFLDLSIRNDWTSMLAPENWSYYFPSISAAWLLEESFDLPAWFDMLKLRASWAGVGNADNRAGDRYFQYGTNPSQYLGLPYGTINASRPNYGLLPEYTLSKETGIQAIMLGNRLNLDLGIYEMGTRDQIFRSPLAPSSGYNFGVINSGYIRNRGFEFQASWRHTGAGGLSWNLGGNLTRQWSQVTELSEEVDFLNLGGIQQGVYIAARYGQPVGLIMGTAFDRDEQGRLILDELSLPRIRTTEDGAIDNEQIIGNSYPKILAGMQGSLSWKRLSLSLHIDSKLGHDIYSLTNLRGAEFGTLAFTTEGRAEWARALEISAITGVPPTDGFMVEGVKNGVPGRYPVDPQQYWDRMTRIDEAFVYNASYIRLRQISLSYRMNPEWFGRAGVNEMHLSVFVNNLAYLMKHTRNISPESSFGTGNATGIEMYAYPELRSLGMSLAVRF